MRALAAGSPCRRWPPQAPASPTILQSPPSRFSLPRLLPATGRPVITVAIGLVLAIYALAFPTATAAAGMTLLQAGMLTGALLPTWRPLPLPLCLGLAAAIFLPSSPSPRLSPQAVWSSVSLSPRLFPL